MPVLVVYINPSLAGSASMRELVRQQPEWAAQAVNEVDGTSHDPATDIVMHGRTNDLTLSHNTPDLAVYVEPGDIDASFAERKMRRWRIQERIRELIAAHLQAHWPNSPPSYDVDCRPINGSGSSTNRNGDVTTWGKPGGDG